MAIAGSLLRTGAGRFAQLVERVLAAFQQDRQGQQHQEHAKDADDQKRAKIAEIFGQIGVGLIE